MTMTTDEGLAAVKRAIDMIPYLEARVALLNRNPNRPEGETIEEIILAALRAIAPGGPLVVVPREPTNGMQVAGMQAFLGVLPPLTKVHDGEVLSNSEMAQRYMALGSRIISGKQMSEVYRAMIAEGEK